jgi:hypothetical protein
MLFSHFYNFVLILVLTSLFSSGYSVARIADSLAAPSPALVQTSPNNLPKALTASVLHDVVRQSGVRIADVKITQARQKTFSNACVFKFGEICSQQYDPIPGWVVHVKVKAQSWTYHINQTNSQLVLDPKVNRTLQKN